jgi:putative ubiquitin-RnfH superfamily antitoxin RatB of RatAB toxin-antitoxin module
LALTGLSGLFFEAAFQTVGNDKTVEIMLFSDANGYLNYVEIDYCGNSEPVPNDVELHPTPFHIYVSKSIAPVSSVSCMSALDRKRTMVEITAPLLFDQKNRRNRKIRPKA